MTLETYEIRDPERLIREVAERVPLEEDTAYAVLVRLPSTEQRIVDVKRLDLPALLDDDDEIRDDLRAVAESYGVPWTRECRYSLVTVVVRPGRCVFGPNESVWLKGWRYSNHLQRIFDSDLILVTEHGWSHFFSRFAGYQPAMVPVSSV